MARHEPGPFGKIMIPNGPGSALLHPAGQHTLGMESSAAPLSTFEHEPPALRARRLAAARRRATALLGAVTVLFVAVTAAGAHGTLLGFVQAGAEASMVGAAADWFAVTALFRHPLGLPIPHTALIPTRKDALGHSLQDFVATNFLAPDVVRGRVAAVGVARRVGNWL